MSYAEAQYVIDELQPMLEELLPVVPGSVTYTTPGTYVFTVPKKVTKLTFNAYGATSGGGGGGGGGGSSGLSSMCNRASGGGGGGGGAGSVTCRLQGTIEVTPGSNITIEVGAKGTGGYAGSYGSAAPGNYQSGTKGTSGGNGGASGKTSIGSHVIFPSVAGGGAGWGGNAGQWCSTEQCSSCYSGFGGAGGSTSPTSNDNLYTISSAVTITTKTETTVTASVDGNGGKTDSYGPNDGTQFSSSLSGGGAGYKTTSGANLGGAAGGAGGAGGSRKGLNAGSNGIAGADGINGYVRLSWG